MPLQEQIGKPAPTRRRKHARPEAEIALKPNPSYERAFRLPPAELGVHPAEGPTYEAGARHLFTLMCDDVTCTTAELKSKGIAIPAGLSPAARGASVDPVRVLRAG
jgi:hypothetical protein